MAPRPEVGARLAAAVDGSSLGWGAQPVETAQGRSPEEAGGAAVRLREGAHARPGQPAWRGVASDAGRGPGRRAGDLTDSRALPRSSSGLGGGLGLGGETASEKGATVKVRPKVRP